MTDGKHANAYYSNLMDRNHLGPTSAGLFLNIPKQDQMVSASYRKFPYSRHLILIDALHKASLPQWKRGDHDLCGCDV